MQAAWQNRLPCELLDLFDRMVLAWMRKIPIVPVCATSLAHHQINTSAQKSNSEENLDHDLIGRTEPSPHPGYIHVEDTQDT